MAWAKAKTAIVAGAVALLAAGTVTLVVSAPEPVQPGQGNQDVQARLEKTVREMRTLTNIELAYVDDLKIKGGNHPAMVSAADFKDLPRLINRLRTQSDPVSAFLWHNLSDGQQSLLNQYQPTEPGAKQTRDVLIKALNRIIMSPFIYEKERFKGVALRPEMAGIIGSIKKGQVTPDVNRMLLEDAYPLELPRDTSDYTRTSHVRFVASGSKYRIECRNESSAPNTIRFYETAFDGTLWAGLNGDTGVMSQHQNDEPNEGVIPVNPLIAHLLFLSKDKASWPHIRWTDMFADRFLSGVNLTHVQNSNGVLQISFSGSPIDGHKTVWKMTMDASGDEFTPATMTQIVNSEFEKTFTFVAYTNVGACRVPSVMSYTVMAYSPAMPPAVRVSGLTKVESVSIPEKIADATFRLDPATAK